MLSVRFRRARGFVFAAIASLAATVPTSAQEAAPATDAKIAERPPAVETALVFERDPVQLVTKPVEVWGLGFSANDEFLAGIGGGGRSQPGPGRLRIRDFAKAKEIASYAVPRGGLSVALSPDGRRVAFTNWAGDVWMRDVDGEELLHMTFERPARVAISPDGGLLAVATEGHRMILWDTKSRSQVSSFVGGGWPFFCVSFSPDGKYLVGGGGRPADGNSGQFTVWDVIKREQVYKIADNLQQVLSISISPDSKTLATSGGNSIALWDLASGTRQSQTEAAKAPVQRILFSPDGLLLATAGGGKNDGAVTLWDAATGKVVGTLQGHRRDVRALAFTHDGKMLVTGSADQSIRLWNVATREQSGTLQESKTETDSNGQAAGILAVAYSPDGTSVATSSEDGRVSIYSLSPPGLVRSWLAHADATAALAYSPDGQILATGGYDKVVKFWNPVSGEQVRSLGGHTGWVVSLAFSHDGQTLASGSYDRSIRLWNVADGVERRVLSGHTATIRSLAFAHSDKLLASGSADRTVRLWNVVDGLELAALAAHEAGVRSIALSSDDRLLASGGEDQVVKIWNINTHDLHGTLTGHTDMVSAVAFAQQTLISTGWDHTIRTWDADALELRNNLITGQAPIVALAVGPDGRRLLTASADQALTLWKSTATENQPTGAFGPYRAFPWSVAYSPDGKSLAVAAGGNADESDLYLYDLATKAEKFHVKFPGSVRSIAFSPAGDLLALGYASKEVLLVDAANGSEIASLEEDRIDVDSAQVARVRSAEVAFSADGKLLAAGSVDRSLRIYDVEHRTLSKTLNHHFQGILSIAFSPDQRELISSSSDGLVKIWDLANSERRYDLAQQPGVVGSVAWSPDGKMLAAGCETGICSLVHAQSGTLLRTISAHGASVNDMRFSPDGTLLATAGGDRTVKLWLTATGELVRVYTCHPAAVHCVRFAPDGKSFATTGRGDGVRIWPVLGRESK